ncbi:hypothetical protein GW932_03290 [archaeon]|nr:hypothetical protein [archaeon]
MKRGIKSKLVTIGIILAIILISFFSLSKPKSELTDADIAKCIGEKSILYVQLGCSHCKAQEDLFGDNLQYLNIIDCFYENEKCQDITATPTWRINNKNIVGELSIEELRSLTRC